MLLFPLTLDAGVMPEVEGVGLSPLSKSQAEKTLKRDDYTCRFCGFCSAQYQRVIPYKSDYVTACSFCEQVLFLERAGIMGSGVLVWLPEISQAELNHIARAIYIARRDEDNDIAKAAERAFEALMARKSEAKKRLGSEDPLLLSTVLSENLKPGERSAAIAKLEGLRLLPLDKHVIRTRNGDVNGFGQMVKFWRSPQGPFGKYPSSEWGTLFEKLIPAEDEKEGKAPLKA